MRDQFSVAGGSVVGFDHVRVGKNNQDAFAWHQDDQRTIAVVCDGCSEGAHSEVGAQLVAQWVVQALVRVLVADVHRAKQPAHIDGWWPFFSRVHDSVCEAMYGTVLTVSGERPTIPTIRDYFLCTVVGVLITAEHTLVFSLGDGCTAVNGTVRMLGPWEGNAPPYIGYALIASAVQRSVALASVMQFHVEAHETASVESVLIATDGVVDLATTEVVHQRTGEHLGGLAQFTADDRYVSNPDMVRRRLTVIGRDGVRADGTPFRLHDDTTVVVVRRSLSLS